MPITPTRSSAVERMFRRIDIEQLKLPLGFIRLVEAVFCLIIFAAFHGWRFELSIRCTSPTNQSWALNRTYEFHSLDGFPSVGAARAKSGIEQYEVKCCNGSLVAPFVEQDYGAGADFYGYLIPFSLFLTVGMLLFYLLFYAVYASDDRIPIIDFCVTALLAVLWMLGTLSFSITSRRIEDAMTFENVNKTLDQVNICSSPEYECTYQTYSVYATLTIASLAGVGLFILFTSNVWYIYKETPYFRNRQSRRDLHHNNLSAAEPYTLE